MQQPIKDIASLPLSLQENILVIPRAVIPSIDGWQGLKKYEEVQLLELIAKHQLFEPRYLMEEDPSYKQIIPYLVFTHNGRYFVMERKAQATEQRLKSKLSIGIGGHLNESDMNGTDIIAWAEREFDEEVSYHGTYTVESFGVINDDSNAVGQVHLGLVLLLKGDSDAIAIKDEHKAGSMMTLSELEQAYDRLESWSQIIVNALINALKAQQRVQGYTITKLVERSVGVLDKETRQPLTLQQATPALSHTIRMQKIRAETIKYYTRLFDTALMSFTYPQDREALRKHIEQDNPF